VKNIADYYAKAFGIEELAQVSACVSYIKGNFFLSFLDLINIYLSSSREAHNVIDAILRFLI